MKPRTVDIIRSGLFTSRQLARREASCFLTRDTSLQITSLIRIAQQALKILFDSSVSNANK
jgi:hypothetical protein